MSHEQLTTPGIPAIQTVIEVTVEPGMHRLAVDLEEWERMDEDERASHVYDAAEELGWFNVSYRREGSTP